ncbi:MAG TPA: hypothetical protein VFE53_10555 [Mucilaginibacter sp.]|jgi:hypothetical protein|nr:hypothetical protein [Mucilaginibacter sp.]
MIGRSTLINHPSGVEIETPVLVPSFSSKGFSFNKKNLSEATTALKLSKEFLTECLLVSAYDLSHKHIPYTEEYLCTEITFIDSGGYETSDIYDISATVKYSHPIKKWTIDKYEEIIGRWPKHKAGIIVSYDHGTERHSLEDQITSAEDIFRKHPEFLNDFLIKPESDKSLFVDINKILPNVKLMGSFSIIGLTEKELGNSILQRMQHIYKVRQALDHVENKAPIHIFGSLDPVTSILYFLAGAEIFDGLTWLKYAYYQGAAIYQSNYGALNNDLGINIRDARVKSESIVKNIYYLDKMKYIMKNFVNTQDFKEFDELGEGMGDFFKKAYKKFTSNL